MNAEYWQQRCEAAEDALRRARSQLMMTANRKKIIGLLAEVKAGRSLPTEEIATRLNLQPDTVHHALHKMHRAGFVDRSKHRGYNGAPVRWKLAHLVLPAVEDEGGEGRA